MPIIYSHQIKERNPKPTPQRKYSNGQWVMFEGKHCQVKAYSFENGIPTYTLKLPTQDGFGEIFTVHQRDLADSQAVTVTESHRQANRDRLESENQKYAR
jgi:hypothetical protein